jgi:hypothetical protein
MTCWTCLPVQMSKSRITTIANHKCALRDFIDWWLREPDSEHTIANVDLISNRDTAGRCWEREPRRSMARRYSCLVCNNAKQRSRIARA